MSTLSQNVRRADPARPGGRRAGFFAICLGYSAIILDGSVLNVAVPTIRRDLHSPMAGVQWVLNGYTLTLAALLLTAGALGDRLGLRRMLLAGVPVLSPLSPYSAPCSAPRRWPGDCPSRSSFSARPARPGSPRRWSPGGRRTHRPVPGSGTRIRVIGYIDILRILIL
jgi:hypothetical protein